MYNSRHTFLVLAIVLFALFATVAIYDRMLRNAQAERDLYAGQILAMEDSIRVLYQENDSLTIAARYAMPGEGPIDTALDSLELPDGVDPSEINQMTAITYLPPADSAQGLSIGMLQGRGFLHRFGFRLRMYEFTGEAYAQGDSLSYRFLFQPRPQRIVVLNRRAGAVNERIVIVPGRLTGLEAFDRVPVGVDRGKRNILWRARVFALAHPNLVLTGLEMGPVWRLWKFDVAAGLGMYDNSDFVGAWASASLTL